MTESRFWLILACGILSERKRVRVLKTFWKVVKYVLLGIMILAIGIILFRVFVSFSDESVLRELDINEQLKTVYRSLPEEKKPCFAKTHDVPYQISEPDGYFTAYAFVWIPEARQIQVVVRFNEKSVRKKLEMSDGESLSFRLANGTSGRTVEATYTLTGEKWMYTYIRLVFDDVDVNDEDDLWIEMMRESEDAPVNRLVCHYALQKSSVRFYSLSRSEMAKLKEE